MVLVILSVAALIFFFISIVNFYYQKAKYKYSTDEELQRLPFFESPSTWGICIIVTAFLLVGTVILCAKYIMGGLSTIEEQKNTVNQNQVESSYQELDNGQSK